ncbi:MAG: sigma-70 family RNA polymerase sigma factor [Candidatus Wallbacteria bacterium]|nr:sigma-70 family RNA polymerase sigma factor [Candidatus Wallbacteria bacterium]
MGVSEDAASQNPDESDRADARLARGGDRAAFRRIVERHQNRVFNLALRILRSREDALEAAQDTFLRAHEKLHQYRPEHRFGNWLLRIAQNLAISRLRIRKPESAGPECDDIADSSPGPEATVGRREQLASVDRCLAGLAEKYRTTLLLRHQEGCSLAEIAYVLDVPIGTVKFRLHQGYLLLRGRLRLSETE